MVTVSADAMKAGDAADLAILPAAELGAWAERGELAPVPFNFRDSGQAYQLSSVLPPFRGEAYAGWGNQSFGLPVAFETSVVVYRADRFLDAATQAEYRTRFNRALGAPATWEEFADIADFFAARDKKPSLPPLDQARLDDLFLRVAACLDRPAQAGDGSGTTASLGFAFDLDTGRSRLETKGFVEAARWLASLKSRGCLPAEGNPDPAAALAEGRAVLALSTLQELMKLPADQKRIGRYGLAALPGTRTVVNPVTGSLVPVPHNYVPYLGGGWLGVVRKGCKHPEAAFALLAELAGPNRSREIVAAGGFAPVRETQLESDRLVVWLGYGFDEARTKVLQDAVRTNIGAAVRNPALGLRIPDEAELREALRAELAAIAKGTVTPEAGLKEVSEKWNREKHLDWHRRAAGLN